MDNLALRRVLNTPPRGIGKATQETLFREAEAMGRSLWDVLRHDRLGNVSTRGKKSLRAFRRLVVELQEDSKHLTLPALLESLLARTDYTSLYRKDDPEDQSRLENIQEFLSAAQEFADDLGPAPLPARLDDTDDPSATEPGGSAAAVADPEPSDIEVDPLTSFLDYVALVSDTDSLKTDLGVSLMTLHSAKGLEFPVVFVAGLEDGLLPHFNSRSPEELEEERRLLYVGMTRAERLLHLSTCRRRRIAGRYQDQLESQFLAEIPEPLLRQSASSQLFESDRTDGVRSFFADPDPGSGSPRAPGGQGSGSQGSGSQGSGGGGFAGRAIRAGSEPPTVRIRTRALEPSAEPRAALGPSSVELSRGTRVRHPMLGAGQILAVEGEGDHAKLTVHFERAGKRRLLAKYAGLEPL
jgi:DNA helicase-2/ATP-dependent DNA helicase PcrA